MDFEAENDAILMLLIYIIQKQNASLQCIVPATH